MIVPRTIKKNIEKRLYSQDKKPVIIIYGPRQAGKTTLIRQIIQDYPHSSEYYNCDFPDVREMFSYENIGNVARLVNNHKLIVLDEAQRIENIGLVLKILHDEFKDLQVIATGSSSFDLSNKVNEPLTGRKIVFRLFPFSYYEYNHKKNLIARKRSIEELLIYGSYPALLNKGQESAREILGELTGSYLFKDIFTFQQLKKPELLTDLLRLLAFQVGMQVSYNELAQKCKADQSVIQRYLHLLEENFVIFRLNSFRKNLRNEIGRSRKIYFWDNGIRNYLIQNLNPLKLRNDTGALWENYCITERMKYLSNFRIGANSFFWRTYAQQEIDYIEESGGKLLAVEFKWKLGKKPSLPRSYREAYPESGFLRITPENFETEWVGE